MPQFKQGDVIRMPVEGIEMTGTITHFDYNALGYDVKLDGLVRIKAEKHNVPWPMYLDEDSSYDEEAGEAELYTIFLPVQDEVNCKKKAPVNHKFEQLVHQLCAQTSELVFRRVHSVNPIGQIRSQFRYYDREHLSHARRDMTAADYQNIPKSNIKNFQKNPNLQYKKKHVLEEGRFHGFSNKRALRGNDEHNGKSIYFNPKGRYEYDIVEEGWMASERSNELVYPGDLVCGLVKRGDKGPYFEKWFLCSEQFMKMITAIRDPHHESIETNHNKLLNRLRSNKFGEWIGENFDASQQEIDERYHRPRYERSSLHPYLYGWIVMIGIYGEKNVQMYDEGKAFLESMMEE